MDKNASPDRTRTMGGMLMKLFSLLAFACAAMPLFACGAQLFARCSPLRWMAVPYLSMLWAWAAILLPARWSRIAVPAAFLMSALPAFFLLGGGPGGMAGAAAAGILCFVMVSRRPRPNGDEWSYAFWMAALVWQLILWSMFSHGAFFDGALYASAARVCAAGSGAYMLLFVMYLNRTNLVSASHADITVKKVSPVIRLRNTAAVILLFLVSLAAGFSETLKKAASALWHGILRVISAVVDFLMSLFSFAAPIPTEEASEGGGGAFPAAGEAERSLLSVILEKVMMAAAAVILAVLLWFALKAVYKLLKKLAARMMEKIGAMMDQASEDYTETVDDTRGEKNEDFAPRSLFKRREGRRRPETGSELVRYLYRRYLKKHPEKKGLTCREALSGDGEETAFSRLYERARYSDHEVSMAESEALEKSLKENRG